MMTASAAAYRATVASCAACGFTNELVEPQIKNMNEYMYSLFANGVTLGIWKTNIYLCKLSTNINFDKSTIGEVGKVMLNHLHFSIFLNVAEFNV